MKEIRRPLILISLLLAPITGHCQAIGNTTGSAAGETVPAGRDPMHRPLEGGNTTGSAVGVGTAPAGGTPAVPTPTAPGFEERR